MIKSYLEPLQEESFMSESEVNNLFGNIQEIYEFQREFLQALEDTVLDQVQPMETVETHKQIKVEKIKPHTNICGRYVKLSNFFYRVSYWR